jgi:hypothetical protein
LSSHEKEGLTLNHFGLNKFEAVDDESFRVVKNRLVKIASEVRTMAGSPRMGKMRFPQRDRYF